MKEKFPKLFIAIALGFFMISSTASTKPIFELFQRDKGLFGYKVVDFTTVYDQNVDDGWTGKCHDPGLSRCRAPGAMPDPVNESNVLNLVDQALLKIANGSRSGSKQVSVQVAGESFLRVYTVTWSATDKTARPTETSGDGQEIDILVDLTKI